MRVSANTHLPLLGQARTISLCVNVIRTFRERSISCPIWIDAELDETGYQLTERVASLRYINPNISWGMEDVRLELGETSCCLVETLEKLGVRGGEILTCREAGWLAV